ncbi:MAG: hypothetical protein H0T53_00795, partial [Herpetosiphonaceae bacterium]|nr:hypothetical protein [Herpetosiphonaceae bacterium]
MSEYLPNADDRQAMRAFLARTEVRLSTMHRIAGVFLNGAGLLILFPVFFRDAISDINSVVLNNLAPLYDRAQHTRLTTSTIVDSILYLALFIPFLITLTIPIYAFYLLLKDIVYFYFAGHSPGFTEKLFNPRFVLSGLAFSTDESPETKREIMKHQYESDLITFIFPFAQHEASYYDQVKTQTEDFIIPETRKIEALREAGVFAATEEPASQHEFNRFNTALGLAGFLDRTLIEEVARSEISVVRNALCLRRLVLRYIKALLMFVWTTLLSFILVSFLSKVPPLIILPIGYVIW